MLIQIELTLAEHKTLMSALEIAGIHIKPDTEQAKLTNKLTLKCAKAGVPKLYPDVYEEFDSKECELILDAPQKIALTLLKDILGRKGYRQEFENMDDDIQNEIVQEWINLIKSNIKRDALHIANSIVDDVSSRSGWENIYDSVDYDIKEEMLSTWADKIRCISSNV